MKKIILMIILALVMLPKYHHVDLQAFRSETIQVEVKGAISKPGVIKVAYNASIKDVLKKVGLKDNADISGINLASKLTNGSVLVVPEIVVETKISINTASLTQLDQLPGIGPSIAQRIIDYRQLHPFQSLEQLMNVKGIKERLFQKVKVSICL